MVLHGDGDGNTLPPTQEFYSQHAAPSSGNHANQKELKVYRRRSKGLAGKESVSYSWADQSDLDAVHSMIELANGQPNSPESCLTSFVPKHDMVQMEAAKLLMTLLTDDNGLHLNRFERDNKVKVTNNSVTAETMAIRKRKNESNEVSKKKKVEGDMTSLDEQDEFYLLWAREVEDGELKCKMTEIYKSLVAEGDKCDHLASSKKTAEKNFYNLKWKKTAKKCKEKMGREN